MRRELGLSTLLIVNDFTALAMSLPGLHGKDLMQVGGGTLTLAGTPLVLSSTVTIQKFGGAGKGHWTMSLPAFETPGGPPTCSEAITSGRLDIDYSNREDED